MNHELKDIKMHDMAESHNTLEAVPAKSKEPYYPSINFDAKQLPELEGKEVGDECHLMLVVKVKGVSERENKDGKTSNYDLEIRKAGIHAGKLDLEDDKKDSEKEKKSEKDKEDEDIFPKNYKNPNKV